MCSNEMKLRRSPRSVLQNYIRKIKKSNTHQFPEPVSLKKSITKTRKHKFLSDLRRELSKPNKKSAGLGSREKKQMINDDENLNHNDHQLNLFPLQPGNLCNQDKGLLHDEEDNNMAYLFDSNDQSGATLNGLIWGSSSGSGGAPCSSDMDSLSPPLAYNYKGGEDGEQGGGDHQSTSSLLMVRKALKHKERDDSEERWVCYSEVVEKIKEEEVSSSTYGTSPQQPDDDHHQNQIQQGLLLKLDYQEIMDAWSDKGPPYIGDCSSLSHQIVPDILDDHLAQHSTNLLRVDAGSMLWRVPDQNDHGSNSGNMEALDGQEEGMKMMMMEKREARVLRYKEKRQSRLFSKRIRYEVRKVNAEKRPRMKGRFVKRN